MLFWVANGERRGAKGERLGRKKKCLQLYSIGIYIFFFSHDKRFLSFFTGVSLKLLNRSFYGDLLSF